MKSNITKLALLAGILTFSAAEATRIQARDRFITKVDTNRVERVLYKDDVRARDRVNDDIRSDARDLIDRNADEREKLAADRNSINNEEANSRGPTRECKDRPSLASRQQNIALKDKSGLNVMRAERRDDAERGSNADREELAAVERRNGVREVALLREGGSRNYRSGRLHNRYLRNEGRGIIWHTQQERLAFELDI